MPTKLLFPDDVREALAKKFAKSHPFWLTKQGVWPLTMGLGELTERDVSGDPAAIRKWVQAWTEWNAGGCSLEWVEKKWTRLGLQRLPATLIAKDAGTVADAVGHGPRWRRAASRYEALVSRWPHLRATRAVERNFAVLADYSDDDFARLESLLEWLEEHPASGMYLRQLPILGLDTKWVEKRQGVVSELWNAVRRYEGPSLNFHETCGLARAPHRLRLRILCPALRASVGGLRDLEAPLDQVAALPLSPSTVLIVENLETGLALPDLPGTVALMKLGLAVSAVQELTWARQVQVIYWGDIDTHGFVILNRARESLSHLQSILMDGSTLQQFRRLAVQEPVQHAPVKLAALTENEVRTYDCLHADTWGVRVRLEQERIPWAVALAAIQAAIAAGRPAAGVNGALASDSLPPEATPAPSA
jgi:hypothetical protein